MVALGNHLLTYGRKVVVSVSSLPGTVLRTLHTALTLPAANPTSSPDPKGAIVEIGMLRLLSLATGA